MSHKIINTTGWIITLVLAFLFTYSAFPKITLDASSVAMATAVGFDESTWRLIGVVELVSLVLFIIPRTTLIGALLLIAYMGGAIATHLQHQQSVVVPIAVQVLVWVATALRSPVLRRQFIPASHSLVQQH